MSMELKAETIMAIRGYENEERREWDEGVDLTVTPAESDEKILLRVIKETKSKSGFVSVDAVTEMCDVMNREDYDKGVLIGKRFTEAAKREMKMKNIQMITEKKPFKPWKLYQTIQNFIDNLCQTKCGHVPENESECKGYLGGRYTCKVRLISDNTSFHLERGWTDFLEYDLMKLLEKEKKLKISKEKDPEDQNGN